MTNRPEPSFDPKQFRQALGKFATGVTVITTREADGTPRGFTANSFTSVSLDPPLILVCLANSAASCDVFTSAENFAVNILGDEQQEISNLFASQRPDKFEVADWESSTRNTPLINGSLAWFDCSRHKVVDAGDHAILIGQVEAFESREGQPLGYFSGRYFNLDVENQLVDAIASNARTVFGAIYEKEGHLLLRDNGQNGDVSVPEFGRDGKGNQLGELAKTLEGQPLYGEIDFVYAVFEDHRTHSVTVYYRGHATGEAPDGYRFYSFAEMPWDRITDQPVKTMIERYIAEAEANEFAIYMGDETEGVVKTLS